MASTSALQFLLLFSLCFSVLSHTCPPYTFSNNKVFTACNALPVFNSFLHWTYHPKTHLVQLAYRQSNVISSSRWISWAINPTSKGMVGAQSLVAFRGSDGVMRAYTSPITSYKTSLKEGKLGFPSTNISAVFENNEMIIFATILLPGNTSRVNHLWQEGPVSGDTPRIHTLTGPNMQSMGSIDFLSGYTAPSSAGSGKQNLRETKKIWHGILCTISWGILMPLGVMIARFLKVFKSTGAAWFYCHVALQGSGVVVGVVGWIIGLSLGAESAGIQYNVHRTMGIVLFCLAILQALAVVLRPNPKHKYRFYWTIYHHTTGYAVILLSIFNIFGGLAILAPEKKWRNAYKYILIILVASWANTEFLVRKILEKRLSTSE